MNAPAAILNRPAAEVAAHMVMLNVLRIRGSVERIAYCFGTLKRNDVGHLLVGIDWALERGYLPHGTNHASAKSAGCSDKLLYITKAGKGWLRTFGSDFGSGALVYAQLHAVSPAYANAAFVVTP